MWLVLGGTLASPRGGRVDFIPQTCKDLLNQMSNVTVVILYHYLIKFQVIAALLKLLLIGNVDNIFHGIRNRKNAIVLELVKKEKKVNRNLKRLVNLLNQPLIFIRLVYCLHLVRIFFLFCFQKQ